MDLQTMLLIARWELEPERILHGLIATGYPQVYLLYFAAFQIVQQVFPGVAILPLACREAEHFPFASGIEAHDGQNGHRGPLVLIDLRKGPKLRVPTLPGLGTWHPWLQILEYSKVADYV